MQNLNESLPELHVEGGVNDGVHRTVHVAQPSESIIHLGGDLATCAVGVQDMGDEERQPAYDEHTCGDGRRYWIIGGGRRRRERAEEQASHREIWVTHCWEGVRHKAYVHTGH